MRCPLLILAAVALAGCDDGDGGNASVADVGAVGDAALDAAPAEDRPACAPLAACGAPGDALPRLTPPVQVVPSDAMPPEVVSQPAHNNLDIVWHDGRLFFAFRTAPNHFASPETRLYVVSTADHVDWRYEGAFHLGTDLREPRFATVGDRLFLYFAVLGQSSTAFEPGETRVAEYRGPGDWSAPTKVFPDTFIPWRIRVIDGVAYLTGYTGGESVYTADGEPIEVYWLRSEDGERWSPVVPDQPVVLSGGVSETDFAFLADGAVVAVGRNEAGEDGVFGSKICRAEADALGDWRCNDDPRKYDSPLVFRHGEGVWLVARRHVTEDGHYDLMQPDKTQREAWAAYQAAYWSKPKRCSLWRVDPEALTVDFVLDLPSAGDTCFASAVPLEGDDVLLYNYSSPVDRPDITWLQGQTGATHIDRMTLTLPR